MTVGEVVEGEGDGEGDGEIFVSLLLPLVGVEEVVEKEVGTKLVVVAVGVMMTEGGEEEDATGAEEVAWRGEMK